MGGLIVCVASGPSLAGWQVEAVRKSRAFTIATNTSFRAVDGGICYGCDSQWWAVYADEVKAKGLAGWTQDRDAAKRHGINWIESKAGHGLCREPNKIHQGGNSGFQAVNLAYHLGARTIVLVGYDMQRTPRATHWHGEHPEQLGNAEKCAMWRAAFPALASDLKAEGVDVVNCTIATALTCFPKADLRDVL